VGASDETPATWVWPGALVVRDMGQDRDRGGGKGAAGMVGGTRGGRQGIGVNLMGFVRALRR